MRRYLGHQGRDFAGRGTKKEYFLLSNLLMNETGEKPELMKQ
jgi:hypothetical protein